MKNFKRLIFFCCLLLITGLHLQAQAQLEESDSTQTQKLRQEGYCEPEPELTSQPDSTENKDWKVRIDLKNWIIQIRKDQ